MAKITKEKLMNINSKCANGFKLDLMYYLSYVLLERGNGNRILWGNRRGVDLFFCVVKKVFCDEVKTFVFSFLLITESVKKCKVSKSVK